MSRALQLVALPLALALLLQPSAGAGPRADEVADRWKAWEADLEYLCEEIDKPPQLRQIFKVKGIEWKKVRKGLEKRFKELAKAAKKRGRDDEMADSIAFYDLLHDVIGQLHDGHAYVEVDEKVREAWLAAEPKFHSAGVELMPGTHGTVIVAYVNPGDPVSGRGVTHVATVLESVNGQDAREYFAERGAEMMDQGGLSTLGRATMLAMHRLEMGEDEKLELIFQVLDASEKERTKYVELPDKKRAKAFKSLKWKKKKLTLRYAECERARNPWSFRCQNAPLPELTETSDKNVTFGRLPSGFGYVRYLGVSKAANEALAQACGELSDCPGLVLDIRRNGGGGDGGAAEIFDGKDGVWKKPVAVLMGPWNMSAGETEVWELQRLRKNNRCNVRFFGTTTAGASGDKIPWELPSGFAKGRFVFKHWHNEQSQIEGSGCEPDVVIDQDVVELSLGIDSHIRAAEAWLDEE